MNEVKNKKIIQLMVIVLLLLGSIINGILLTKQLYYKKEIKEEIKNIDNDNKDITDIDSKNQINEDVIIVDTTIVDEDDENDDNPSNTDVTDDNKKDDNSNIIESNNKNNSSNSSQSDNNQSNTTNNSKEDGNNKNNNTTNKNNTNNDNNKDNNNNNTNNKNDEETKKDTPLTQEEINNNYRNTIQDTYSIKIAYGNEMGDYLIGYYAPTKLTDDKQINEYLKRIETEMKKYPKGFFKEMKDFGMPLTIYVVKDIPNSEIAGLTDSQFASNVIISVKTNLFFENTLNHEIMHYIDTYISMKMYPDEISTSWNKLNPSGYKYGSFDTSLDFMTTQDNNAYFLSNYAQTNWLEDRATLFGDAMTMTSKRSCYTVGTPLYNKMKLISEQIDKYYTSVNGAGTQYWERFL